MTQVQKGETEGYEPESGVYHDSEEPVSEYMVSDSADIDGYSDNPDEYETYYDLTADDDSENARSLENSYYSDGSESFSSYDSTEYYETETGTAEDVISGLDSIIKSIGTGTPDVSNIVLGAVTVASGASAMVMNVRKKIKNKALDCINLAEEEFINQSKAGKSKKLFAVQTLTNSVPALLRPFVSSNFAEKAIDSGFNNMNKFAKLQNVKDDTELNTEEPIFDDIQEAPDDTNTGERFAAIADLIKNKGKSFELNSHDSYDIPSEQFGEETDFSNEQEEYEAKTQISKRLEEKSPVVVNLFIEQPDGSLVKECRKQANGESVNINIGYKCNHAGENNSFCKECVFNKY